MVTTWNWESFNPEAQPERRAFVVDVAQLQQQGERLLDRTAIPAGELYVRLQRLENAIRFAEKAQSATEQVQAARELRITMGDVEAALAILTGVVRE